MKPLELEPTGRTINDSELRQLPKRQVNNITKQLTKPLEFKIERRFDEVDEDYYYTIVFYYEDGSDEEIYFYDDLPKGLELNRHYSIADIYGYKVIDDRKGL